MWERLRSALMFASVTSLVALVFAMGGGAYALTSIVVSGTAIHGCYQKKSGNLRVIAAGKKCRKSERAIGWNQTGPRGLPGLQGQQGVKGDTGPPGQPGSQAAPGTNGTNGTNGASGTNGSSGVGIDAMFGDGSDGSVTISTARTLTRDMYYQDLTIAAGQTLNPGGYRVFVSGTLTLNNGSSIARNGNPASAGGAGLAPGTLGGSAGGGSGGEANSLGGNGGSGNGQSGGAAIPPSAAAGGSGVFRSAIQALSGRALDATLVNGGAGGGGAPGFGGPGGGGVVVVAARTVALSSGAATITANGGSSDSNACPCGGGGGGVVVVISTTPHPAGLTLRAQGGGSLGSAAGSPGFTDWLS
jgi:hypothetical protein